MITIITSLLVGIGASLFASYTFLHFFLLKKIPTLDISTEICKESIKSDNYKFAFKFVNKTDVPIYDVQLKAAILTPIGKPGGQDIESTPLRLKSERYSYIPCEISSDKHDLHAVQVICLENIDDIWNNPSSFIRFEVVAKHELSGFSKVSIQDYHSKEIIKLGKFKFGNELNVQ